MISFLSPMYVCIYPNIHTSSSTTKVSVTHHLCNSFILAFYLGAIPIIHVPCPWLMYKLLGEENDAYVLFVLYSSQHGTL